MLDMGARPEPLVACAKGGASQRDDTDNSVALLANSHKSPSRLVCVRGARCESEPASAPLSLLLMNQRSALTMMPLSRVYHSQVPLPQSPSLTLECPLQLSRDSRSRRPCSHDQDLVMT